MGVTLGSPRVHLRELDSTNTFARGLALRGAPHGTLVTAGSQLAGRGRQGRSWAVIPGESLICSWVIRDPQPLLSLASGVAVAEVCGPGALLKWPNDVLLDGRKVAGILVEARPQERWAVLGIGLNVAVRLQALPAELRERAGTLGLDAAALEPTLGRLCAALQAWIEAPEARLLEALRARDALLGRSVSWAAGSGVGAGIDAAGRLIVTLADGSRALLDAGEVHLSRS